MKEKQIKEIYPSFVPRKYQAEMMRSFFIHKKKRLLVIWHRRAGKDITSFNIMWLAAIQKPGLYLYLLPVISQAATVIWRGRGSSGQAFIDNIPSELIAKKNESTMSITLINGSIIRVTGSDAFDSLIGCNALGIVFSEFQNSDIRALELLRPIVSENSGFILFTATPRGHNHLYELYQTNKDNPDWFVQVLTVDDTFREDGTPVISAEMIEEERRGGMQENIIQQEFFASFSAAIKGAYYADEMRLIAERGRITNFNIDAYLPVHVSFDLGISDATSVCLFQVHPNGDIKVIYHWEESGKELAHYAFRLEKLKSELGFKKYGHMFFPHDIKVRELGSGLTRIEQLRKCGINPRIVGNHRVVERIQCVRAMMHKVWFLEKNCKLLIRALSEYKGRWDDKHKTSTGPVHDLFSHAADSFGYFAVGYLEAYDNKQLDIQKKYASFIP
jgi:phage terminase large subunit